MIKILTVSLALALTAASAQVMRPATPPATSDVIRVGLDDQPNQPASLQETCKDVSFTRDVKYGDDAANVLSLIVRPCARIRCNRPRRIAGVTTKSGDVTRPEALTDNA